MITLFRQRLVIVYAKQTTVPANLETEKSVEGTGNYYMYKPFQLDDLIAMVSRMIIENP